MRVLEGGDGWTSGGRSERSRVSGDLFSSVEDCREGLGEGKTLAISKDYVCVSATKALGSRY